MCVDAGRYSRGALPKWWFEYVRLLFHLRTAVASTFATVAAELARSVSTCISLFRQGWFCQFLEEDLKTPLPRKITFADEKKIFEVAKRGGFTLNIAGRQELQKRSGRAWEVSGLN